MQVPQSILREICERVLRAVALVASLGIFATVVALTSGCVHEGAQLVEGTDVVVGLTVPGTDGVLQLNALHYLSGFRMGVAKNASVTVEYSTVSTNAFFGCVYTASDKHIKATVTPRITSDE